MRNSPFIAVLGAVVLAAVSACSTSGLDFRADDRLTITTPADRSGVRVPVPVAWTLEDPLPSETSFAVLVDVEPAPTGHLDRGPPSRGPAQP